VDELDPLPVVVGGSVDVGVVRQSVVAHRQRTVAGASEKAEKHSGIGMVQRLDLQRLLHSKQVRKKRKFKTYCVFRIILKGKIIKWFSAIGFAIFNLKCWMPQNFTAGLLSIVLIIKSFGNLQKNSWNFATFCLVF
jgi:hypothetical protein